MFIYMGKDTALQIGEIYEILKTRNISTGVIRLYRKDDRIVDYLLDNKYILRISKSMPDEQMKQDRVKQISFVPKIQTSGSFSVSGQNYYFLITDYVKGTDLYSVLQKLTDEQNIIIGREIAQFLIELHSITGPAYDIGHYIAAIPKYKQSWKDGHLDYVKSLRIALSAMNAQSKSEKIISSAFDYIYANVNCLEYQAGARLLHNDFHPKNIIIYKRGLAGIIDWECSQFGEEDFELTHLFHWCIYPLKPDDKYELLLKSVFENLTTISNVPNIEKRLTIYQLEHELNQLVWNGRKQEKERIQRINGWLNGKIEDLLEKWQKK
jgi:aminoglycoside phosphotransferase (APT) family kinase protein